MSRGKKQVKNVATMTKCATRQTRSMTMSEHNKVAINAMVRNLQPNTLGLPEAATSYILKINTNTFTCKITQSGQYINDKKKQNKTTQQKQ